MLVHIFQSSQGSLFGATQDPAGSNLDPARGPWKSFKAGVTLVPGSKMVAIDPDKAIAAIKADGVYYWSAAIQNSTN